MIPFARADEQSPTIDTPKPPRRMYQLVMMLLIGSVLAPVSIAFYWFPYWDRASSPLRLPIDLEVAALPKIDLSKSYGHAKVKVGNITSGDTMLVDVDEWPAVIGRQIPVRVFGIDAPEVTDDNDELRLMALAARDFTSRFLTSAKVVELRFICRDKYFRLHASVYADDKSLAEALLDAGLARPYIGGEKKPWTLDDAKMFKPHAK